MLVAGAKGWDSETVPASACKYVRRVNGPWQARVFAGPHSGSPRLNLGLHPSAREAWQAVKTWLRTGELPDGVLPTYVRRHPAGGFFAVVRRSGRRVEVLPVETVEECQRLLDQALAAAPPRPRRPRAGQPAIAN